jgi:hypothetical protein
MATPKPSRLGTRLVATSMPEATLPLHVAFLSGSHRKVTVGAVAEIAARLGETNSVQEFDHVFGDGIAWAERAPLARSDEHWLVAPPQDAMFTCRVYLFDTRVSILVAVVACDRASVTGAADVINDELGATAIGWEPLAIGAFNARLRQRVAGLPKDLKLADTVVPRGYELRNESLVAVIEAPEPVSDLDGFQRSVESHAPAFAKGSVLGFFFSANGQGEVVFECGMFADGTAVLKPPSFGFTAPALAFCATVFDFATVS